MFYHLQPLINRKIPRSKKKKEAKLEKRLINEQEEIERARVENESLMADEKAYLSNLKRSLDNKIPDPYGEQRCINPH